VTSLLEVELHCEAKESSCNFGDIPVGLRVAFGGAAWLAEFTPQAWRGSLPFSRNDGHSHPLIQTRNSSSY
jgi:hypothetical protein